MKIIIKDKDEKVEVSKSTNMETNGLYDYVDLFKACLHASGFNHNLINKIFTDDYK